MEIRPDLPTENWQWSSVQLRPMSRPMSRWLWKRRKEVGPLKTVPAPIFTFAGVWSGLSIGVHSTGMIVSTAYVHEGKNHRLGDRVLVPAGGSGVAVCALSAGAEAARV